MEDTSGHTEDMSSRNVLRRLDEDFVVDRVRDMTSADIAGMRGNPSAVRAEAEENDEILERVLRESVIQKEKEDEMRRMAGNHLISDDEEDEDTTQAYGNGELNTWMNTPLSKRLASALALTNAEMIAAENASSASSQSNKDKSLMMPDNLPYEEQLMFMQTLSERTKETRETQQDSKGREQVVVVPSQNNDFDDEQIKKAIQLSLDPSQQIQSEDAFGAIGAAAAVPAPRPVADDFPPLDVHEQIESDAEFARALEISRQDHARSQIMRHLEEEKLFEKVTSTNEKGAPRPIVIDGNNVAFHHSNHVNFSVKGLLLVYEYFNNKGHEDITIFCTPNHVNNATGQDKELFTHLLNAKILKTINNRRYGGQVIGHYDDLFIIRAAKENGGIIVTNDKFRDVYDQYEEFRDTIKYSVLCYQFVNNIFIPAEDPLGRHGPRLRDFLKF